uniref:UBIQUITIN_CONJUGAT_2 domain-containing protein n=1 Tax=Trichuris muris TaxID=70415 RepID=A0A5S6R4C7_TRIMR
MSGCVQPLKEELNSLRRAYPDEEGKPFRIVQANLDEMDNSFWYTSCDDATVQYVLNELRKHFQMDGTLAEAFGVPSDSVSNVPNEDDQVSGEKCSSSVPNELCKKNGQPLNPGEPTESTSMVSLTIDNEKAKHDLLVHAKIEKPHQKAFANMQGSDSTASIRLMKDLSEIYASSSYANGVFDVELVDDSLLSWLVKLKKIDPDSHLAQDLLQWKSQTDEDYILLSFTFPTKYPFEPPFVYIVRPFIQQGFVMDGGAICMELLTPKGWSSVYSVESVILQIAATLVKGDARILMNHDVSASPTAARATFKKICDFHEQTGWHISDPKLG